MQQGPINALLINIVNRSYRNVVIIGSTKLPTRIKCFKYFTLFCSTELYYLVYTNLTKTIRTTKFTN